MIYYQCHLMGVLVFWKVQNDEIGLISPENYKDLFFMIKFDHLSFALFFGQVVHS